MGSPRGPCSRHRAAESLIISQGQQPLAQLPRGVHTWWGPSQGRREDGGPPVGDGDRCGGVPPGASSSRTAQRCGVGHGGEMREVSLNPTGTTGPEGAHLSQHTPHVDPSCPLPGLPPALLSPWAEAETAPLCSLGPHLWLLSTVST